jgi:hypothetical protein
MVAKKASPTRRPDVYHDIHCPSCGRYTAQLSPDPHRSTLSWLVTHSLCGYRGKADSLYEEALSKHIGRRNFSQSGNLQNIYISLEQDFSQQTVKAIQVLRQHFPAFLESFEITLQGEPENLNCPVCGKDDFWFDGLSLVCSDHYQVSALEYLIASIKKLDYGASQNRETISITKSYKPTGLKIFTQNERDLRIAQIEFRSDDEKFFLVVSRGTDGNGMVYDNFVSSLSKSLKPPYCVIVKVES